MFSCSTIPVSEFEDLPQAAGLDFQEQSSGARQYPRIEPATFVAESPQPCAAVVRQDIGANWIPAAV